MDTDSDLLNLYWHQNEPDAALIEVSVPEYLSCLVRLRTFNTHSADQNFDWSSWQSFYAATDFYFAIDHLLSHQAWVFDVFVISV